MYLWSTYFEHSNKLATTKIHKSDACHFKAYIHTQNLKIGLRHTACSIFDQWLLPERKDSFGFERSGRQVDLGLGRR